MGYFESLAPQGFQNNLPSRVVKRREIYFYFLILDFQS